MTAPDVHMSHEGPISLIEFANGPHNHLNPQLLDMLATALEQCDESPRCRVVVLSSQGSVFCAGANFNAGNDAATKRDPTHFYGQAMRLFRTRKPLIAAIQGAAIGAGLGLAMAADFRIASPQSRFSANFAMLGMHPGFGLTYTLPLVIGKQHAALLFLTGRRINGDEAARIGLVDRVSTDHSSLRQEAIALASEIAACAPLAAQGARATLRSGFADAVEAASLHERQEQVQNFLTADFGEGVAAAAERRAPVFIGR